MLETRSLRPKRRSISIAASIRLARNTRLQTMAATMASPAAAPAATPGCSPRLQYQFASTAPTATSSRANIQPTSELTNFCAVSRRRARET